MAKETKTAVTELSANGNLLIVRQPIIGKDGKQMITKDGRPYFAYCVFGKVRGQEKKVDFAPKDMGGYEPLDILFDISEKAELIISDEIMEINGQKSTFTSYKAQVVDEDGEIWDCNIKPQRDSDKALLKFLLIEVGKSARATAE